MLNIRARRRLLALCAVPVVTPIIVIGLPGQAQAVVVATAAWHTPFAGRSACEPASPTSLVVVCSHAYTSTSVLPSGRAAETCFVGGVVVAIDPTRADSCHAELRGVSSGPGRMIDDDVAVCDTTGVNTFDFSITTPFGPYSMTILLVNNNDVVTYFDQVAVLVGGPTNLVQHVSGYYTGGCGLPGQVLGTFHGTWTLTAA